MTKDEFITERTRIISEMLDNPDKYGIYPTTKCFEALDALFDKINCIISDEEINAEALLLYPETDDIDFKDQMWHSRNAFIVGASWINMRHNKIGKQ